MKLLTVQDLLDALKDVPPDTIILENNALCEQMLTNTLKVTVSDKPRFLYFGEREELPPNNSAKFCEINISFK